MRALAISPVDHIFAGTFGGVFRSIDNGGHWSAVNNGLMTGNGINALMATVSGHLFAGSYGDGIFRSTDNDDNWIQVNSGLTAPFVLSFATNGSGDIFAGAYFGNGVFRSTDNGDSWNEKNNGLIATEVRTIITQGPIPRIQPSNIDASDSIFAGTYGRGTFRSTDSGQNWQQINNGLLALYESAGYQCE